jgi:hypothetical protein
MPLREGCTMCFIRLPHLLVFACLGSVQATARDLHVGREVATIAQAIRLAQPGDTIHLEPRVYHEDAGFHARKGEPGRPITLDGHGATLDGSEPLDPAQWRELEPALWVADDLLPMLSDSVLGRWYFLFDGRMQRMGRTSKGRKAAFKEPAGLQPGEWTFVRDTSREDPSSKRIHGRFFIRLAPGRSLAQAGIRLPVRAAGVHLSGDNAHLVIRNLTATHVYNDGFNIHGDCREVVFENIRAIECGDDGISAHESAQYRVDGLVSIGNSTGITDIGTARTSYRNVFLARNVGYDLYFLDEGRYSLTKALIHSSAQNPLVITGRAGGECRVVLEQVHLKRRVEPRLGVVARHAVLEARQCTFEGLELQVTGTATWDNCRINGRPMPPDQATATGAGDLSALRPSSEQP